MSQSDTQSPLPLTETTFFILLTLASGSKHGYAIMKEVTVLSNGRIHLGTGTLYGALKRLLDQNWIIRFDDAKMPANGRNRKAYNLTDQGRRILQAETQRLEALVTTAQQVVTGVKI